MSSPEPIDRNALAERLFALDEPRARPQFSVPWAEDEQAGRIQVYEPEQSLYRPARGRPRRMDPSALQRPRRLSCPKPLRLLIIKRDGGICQLCGEQVKDPSIDRIIPGSLGGKYTEDNCQLTCSECNSRKSSLLVLRFAYASRARKAALRAQGLI